MSISENLMFVGLTALGGLFLVAGILSRTGYLRWVYAMKGHPILTPNRFAYVLIPIGIMTLFLGLLPFLPQVRGDLAFYIFFALLITIYVLAIWLPWWLKPAWLRWLEKDHGDILHLLWEDVRKDRWGWERRVRTQAGLEAWVAEVRRKHGLER